MTIQEIDKSGFTVRMLKRINMPERGNVTYVLLKKRNKLYIAWKPECHEEYTTPFCISKAYAELACNTTLH